MHVARYEIMLYRHWELLMESNDKNIGREGKKKIERISSLLSFFFIFERNLSFIVEA